MIAYLIGYPMGSPDANPIGLGIGFVSPVPVPDTRSDFHTSIPKRHLSDAPVSDGGWKC